MIIKVNDNGVGIKQEKLREIHEKLTLYIDSNGKSIGMINVNQRIKIHYGKKYGLTVESEFGKGTIATLYLPI